jgi:hypothetical protein
LGLFEECNPTGLRLSEPQGLRSITSRLIQQHCQTLNLLADLSTRIFKTFLLKPGSTQGKQRDQEKYDGQ